jgi:hypothetical protein
MSSLTFTSIPRGAAPLASLAAAAYLWARKRLSAEDRTVRAQQAAERLRQWARQYEASQPSYAADLRAAADMHDRLIERSIRSTQA